MPAYPANRRQFLADASSVLIPATAAAGKVRIGIVGGGFGASFQWHLHPNCEVAAVCDIRPERLETLARTYRCPNRYKTFGEMLKHPELDAVGVFTPAPLHAWMVVEAMKAGKHAISAVPAAMSEEELQWILETVRKTGLRYMMAETSFYRPEIVTCAEWSRQGRFGTVFYSEAEYHHEGLLGLFFDDRGLPTWRHGFPPMHYPTHCLGAVIPVIRERMTEVQAIGWGDGHEVLRTNQYRNPFWNTTAFFKTSGGHACRVAVYWHVAAGGTERAQFYGDRMSYIMERPERSPNTVIRISTEGKVLIEAYKQADHMEKLPEPMRVKTGHGNSHTFLTHEFVSAILEERRPAVDIWEAIAYTLPGIVAHQSALKGGEPMKIRDYGEFRGQAT
jgi:predicted dehydrogenase